MKTLKSYCESLLSDDPDIDDYGALAAAMHGQWGDPNQVLSFKHVGDALEIDCAEWGGCQVYDLDVLCSIGMKTIKFTNAASVRIDQVSSIKNINIIVTGYKHPCLYIDDCQSHLTIENVTLSADFIRFGTNNPKAFDCKLSNTNIQCEYIRFKGMSKLSMTKCKVQAESMFISNIYVGNFHSKISKINIGQFGSRITRIMQPWPKAFSNFPEVDKDIELLELDIEKLLGIKNNDLSQLKRLVLSDPTGFGLAFFKRGLGALPLSEHSRCAECAGPWEVSVTKKAENELPINYRYH